MGVILTLSYRQGVILAVLKSNMQGCDIDSTEIQYPTPAVLQGWDIDSTEIQYPTPVVLFNMGNKQMSVY